MMARKWLLATIVVVGIGLVLTGLFRSIVESRSVKVEYIENGDTEETKNLVVDIEGGVINPGVYELPTGSRIKDALAIAGGLSVEANREILIKTFNLAQPLKDGQKILIPIIGTDSTEVGYARLKDGGNLININEANESELDTLEGIGQARAKLIIENRPYGSVEELVTKGVLTRAVLEKIMTRVSVY